MIKIRERSNYEIGERERFEDVIPLALKMEEEPIDIKWGSTAQAASRSYNRKSTDPSLSIQKERSPANPF